MAQWPVDSRISTGPAKSKRKKEKENSEFISLEHGRIGAASVANYKDSLRWITTIHSEHDTCKVLSNPAVKLFPATLPPSTIIPQTSIVRRAELGANFLRTHFPDVDVAGDLIREQLEEDSKQEKELHAFDPSHGNQLDLITMNQSMLLAFPMADLNRCLNLSPLVPSQNGLLFKPSASSAIKLDTPIQQIVSSKSDRVLAVRSLGSTSVFQISPTNALRQLQTVRSSDVGGQSVVDMKPFFNPPENIFVNQAGAVYGGILDVALLQEGEDYSDGFWRLGLCEHPRCTFLVGSRRLQYLDHRLSPFQHIDVFQLGSSKELFTSLEDTGSDGIIRLASTQQIFWLDSRMPGKPLIAYQHKRQFDRTLESRTVFFDDGPMTLLTSKRNGLATVYDMQSLNEGTMHMRTRPSRLMHSIPMFDAYFTGHTVLRAHRGETALLSLTDRGSIYSIDFGISDLIPLGCDWSHGVQNLEAKSYDLRFNSGPLAERERSEVNMRPVYNKAFTSYLKQSKEDEEQDAESVYELIEQIPSFWQTQDVAMDQILTTYDVVFRSGEEPLRASRSDFLTGSVINSVRGRRALAQGRLSADVIAKGANWHYNLRPILERLECEVAGDMKTLADDLERFTLVKDGRTSHSLQLEAEAKEQLAFDLSLSSDIFCSRSLANSAMVDNTLETLTESLSLNAEPPPVDLQFFQPIWMREKGERNLPIGVRLLLQDWDLGTDPEKYSYKDPYNSQDYAPAASPKPPIPDRHLAQPPPVVAAPKKAFIPPVVRAQGAQSQPVASPAGQPIMEHSGYSFSQEPMTNTQIVAGPFGSRMAMKKKPQKKRLGGF